MREHATPPRLTVAELGLLTHKLSLLLRSGVQLLDALGTIALQAEHSALGRALKLIHHDMAGGRSLSSSLRDRLPRLPLHYTELVHAGEESGSLPNVLERLGADLEHARDLRREVAQASMYPIFVSIASVLLGIAILTLIVPAFRELYADFGVELPVLTRAALATSSALTTGWPLLMAAAAGILLAAPRIAASPRGALLMRSMALRLPLYGPFLRACALSRLTGALGILIGAGIPIPAALALVARAAPHAAARQELGRWSHMTQQGISLSSLARGSAAFPSEVAHMIALGESSGRLEEVLAALSALYHREARERAATAQVLIEPLLVAVAGVIVGTLLLAVYLPIFELGGITDS